MILYYQVRQQRYRAPNTYIICRLERSRKTTAYTSTDTIPYNNVPHNIPITKCKSARNTTDLCVRLYSTTEFYSSSSSVQKGNYLCHKMRFRLAYEKEISRSECAVRFYYRICNVCHNFYIIVTRRFKNDLILGSFLLVVDVSGG